MVERRRSVRQKSFLAGCIYFNDRRRSAECLIREISDQGARIVFSRAVNIPDLVELYVPQREQTVRARVHWRKGNAIGLTFPRAAPTPSVPPASNELAQRVSQLEAEILLLRRMFAKPTSPQPMPRQERTATALSAQLLATPGRP
jgi:hypothetical protein